MFHSVAKTNCAVFEQYFHVCIFCQFYAPLSALRGLQWHFD